jgi:hypothetical protein
MDLAKVVGKEESSGRQNGEQNDYFKFKIYFIRKTNFKSFRQVKKLNQTNCYC